jgi:hypothetical protein
MWQILYSVTNVGFECSHLLVRVFAAFGTSRGMHSMWIHRNTCTSITCPSFHFTFTCVNMCFLTLRLPTYRATHLSAMSILLCLISIAHLRLYTGMYYDSIADSIVRYPYGRLTVSGITLLKDYLFRTGNCVSWDSNPRAAAAPTSSSHCARPTTQRSASASTRI